MLIKSLILIVEIIWQEWEVNRSISKVSPLQTGPIWTQFKTNKTKQPLVNRHSRWNQQSCLIIAGLRQIDLWSHQSIISDRSFHHLQENLNIKKIAKRIHHKHQSQSYWTFIKMTLPNSWTRKHSVAKFCI